MKRIIIFALAIMALWSSSVSCIRIDITPESSLPSLTFCNETNGAGVAWVATVF